MRPIDGLRLRPLFPLRRAASCVYIIACAYRLARFNVGALLPNKNKKRDPPVALGSPKFSAGELPPAATAPRSRHSRSRARA
jgi:hypothetical protein